MPDKGRVLFATRDISPLELVLVDPGTVVGPNYKSEPVCLQCLRGVTSGYRSVLIEWELLNLSSDWQMRRLRLPNV